MRAGTSERPPTLQATHNGISLFPQPVPLPGFACTEACEVGLSAATSPTSTDNIWVDNLRIASSPAEPTPPSLVRARAASLLLAWFAPHHGGEQISLYRLQRWETTSWRSLYIGPATQRLVTNLQPATRYLFRLQAYNAVGWGGSSRTASYSTAVPPLTNDIKPPHHPRSAGSIVKCGGRVYSVGGQPLDSRPGVSGPGRRYLSGLEQYDTETRSWLRRSDMRVPRSHPALACVRERTLLVVGGYGALGEPPYTYEGPLVSSEEYDPASDKWFVRRDAPSARYHASTASEPHGRVFVAGGFGTEMGHRREAYGTEAILRTFEQYDPHTSAWVRKAPMPFEAYGLGLTVFDCARYCKVIAAGGYRTARVVSDAAAVFDSRAGMWRIVASLPAPRFGMTMLSHPDEAHAYATGGYEKLHNMSMRPWSARNVYVSVYEYHRPEPARCQHGRIHLGCLGGHGAQRDEHGHQVPIAERALPPQTDYPPKWHPPLDLAPASCADCLFIDTDSVDGSTNLTATFYAAGMPPRLPDDPDLYAVMANLSHASMAELEDDLEGEEVVSGPQSTFDFILDFVQGDRQAAAADPSLQTSDASRTPGTV